MARQSNPDRWKKHLATPAYVQNVIDQVTTRAGLQLLHHGKVCELSRHTYCSTMLVFEIPRACGVVYAILDEAKHNTVGRTTSAWEIGLRTRLSPTLLPRRTYSKNRGPDEPDYAYEDYAPQLFRGEYWRDLPHFMPAPGRPIGSGMEFRLVNASATDMELGAALSEDRRIGHKEPISVAYAVMSLLDKVRCYIAPAPPSENLTTRLDIEFWPPTCGHEKYRDKQKELWQNCSEEAWQKLSRLAPDEIAKFRANMR